MKAYMGIKSTLFCFMVIASAGCDQHIKSDEFSKNISESNAKIAELENKINSLSAEVESIKSKTEFNELISRIDTTAYLTPGADGYSIVAFDLGKLTVHLANVIPYANGSKVTIRFGNILLVAVNGVKATIDWGEVDEKGTAKNETAKSKEVTFIETLKPGSWVPVSVVLEGTPPEKLGFIRIRNIHHTGIELYTK